MTKKLKQKTKKLADAFVKRKLLLYFCKKKDRRMRVAQNVLLMYLSKTHKLWIKLYILHRIPFLTGTT